MEKTTKTLNTVNLEKGERIEIGIGENSSVDILKDSEGLVTVYVYHHQTSAHSEIELKELTENKQGSERPSISWSKCRSSFKDISKNVTVHHMAFNKW